MFLLQKVIEGITDRTEVVFAVLYHNHCQFSFGFFPHGEIFSPTFRGFTLMGFPLVCVQPCSTDLNQLVCVIVVWPVFVLELLVFVNSISAFCKHSCDGFYTQIPLTNANFVGHSCSTQLLLVPTTSLCLKAPTVTALTTAWVVSAKRKINMVSYSSLFVFETIAHTYSYYRSC